MSRRPSQRLRRSQRGKALSYKAGDIVEIVRGDNVITGQLLHKIEQEEDPSGLGDAPRWLVAFDDESEDDEEIGEKSLGRLVSEIPTTGTKNNGSAASSNNKDDNSDSGTASEIGHESSTSKKSTNKAFADTAESSTERRTSPLLGSTTTITREDVAGISTRSSAKRKESDEPVLYAGVQTGKRRGGNRGGGKKAKKNEDVVKVKMLTGTLYLYRGDHPRAEFVRLF